MLKVSKEGRGHQMTLELAKKLMANTHFNALKPASLLALCVSWAFLMILIEKNKKKQVEKKKKTVSVLCGCSSATSMSVLRG